jgi:aspartyl-tRNA(Asn)/glutamyl-tRNA(Gln) amidotransferase subunit A
LAEATSWHPFALKDIYDTAGILTTGHSRTCIDRVPDKNATTVARLKLAHGGPSFDLPWQPARNPGTRRSSQAARRRARVPHLLPAHLVPASLGSIPAARCAAGWLVR